MRDRSPLTGISLAVGAGLLWLLGFGAGALAASPEVTIADLPIVTEHTASVIGRLDFDAEARIYLHWGLQAAGANAGQWEHTLSLGLVKPGRFVVELDGLALFRQYFYAFHAVSGGKQSWSAVGSFRPQIQGLLYSTGFEGAEQPPFVAGSLDGQGGWRVAEGSALVQQAVSAHGAQAVQAGPGLFEINPAQAQPVLWVDAFFLETGSTNQPMLPTNAASSVIFFSATHGILALDGDGQGNGVFVQVVPAFATNQFVRLTIRSDYAAKRYDVWINGVCRRAGLGFKDNSVKSFSGARRQTDLPGYLDDFSVSLWGLDADRDGDGLDDLDEAKFYGSYPLLADSDGDGANDGQEVIAGTDPADEKSVFALRVVREGSANTSVHVPTVTGRQYTLQRRPRVDAAAWEDVPGATGIAGDGTEKVFVETGAGESCFYRGVVAGN
jgi:hypothetical protein